MSVQDNFMHAFKYYKSKECKPSLGNVLFSGFSCDDNKVTRHVIQNEEDERTNLMGLVPLSKWETFSFADHSGLFLIRNPFTSLGQRYWIRKCLEEYPKKPNKKNIDIECDVEDWWKESYSNNHLDAVLLKKLRWTTLGYHHNWDSKIYTDDNRNDFPPELAELTDVVAKYFGQVDFKAEAAIVNYYHMKSTLSAHTDHSEVNLEAPLFSFSFGQSAIFLIGGTDKSTIPSAILLRSGDIMVMSKEARLCYHAVPKILPSNITPWNDEINSVAINEKVSKFRYILKFEDHVLDFNKNVHNEEWFLYNNYVKESRINMNVRQVLNKRQTCLTDPVYAINDI